MVSGQNHAGHLDAIQQNDVLTQCRPHSQNNNTSCAQITTSIFCVVARKTIIIPKLSSFPSRAKLFGSGRCFIAAGLPDFRRTPLHLAAVPKRRELCIIVACFIRGATLAQRHTSHFAHRILQKTRTLPRPGLHIFMVYAIVAVYRLCIYVLYVLMGEVHNHGQVLYIAFVLICYLHMRLALVRGTSIDAGCCWHIQARSSDT